MKQQTATGKAFAEKAFLTAASAVLFFGVSAAQAMSHGGGPAKQKQAKQKQAVPAAEKAKQAATAKAKKQAVPAAQQQAATAKKAVNSAAGSETASATAQTAKQTSAPSAKQASSGIYNLKTKAKGAPADPFGKYYLLVAEGCRSCDQVLSGIKTICSGKKPEASKVGFFVTGQNEKKMLKKLKDYAGYDVFSGSTDDMFASYGFQGAPALLAKEKGKIISGKDGILNVLKKDGKLCDASAKAPVGKGKKAGA